MYRDVVDMWVSVTSYPIGLGLMRLAYRGVGFTVYGQY